MFKEFKQLFIKSPKVRFYIRTFVVGVIGYVTAALAQGQAFGDWHSFLWAALAAGANAVIGLLTPTEPLIGVKKFRAVSVRGKLLDDEGVR